MNTPVFASIDIANRTVELLDLDTEVTHVSEDLDAVMDDLTVEVTTETPHDAADWNHEFVHWDSLEGDMKREEIEQHVRDWAKRNRWDITEIDYFA